MQQERLGKRERSRAGKRRGVRANLGSCRQRLTNHMGAIRRIEMYMRTKPRKFSKRSWIGIRLRRRLIKFSVRGITCLTTRWIIICRLKRNRRQ